MKYDQETIRKARQTDLVSFLQQNGYTLKKEGKEYRVKEFSGILVNGNMYYDFVSDKGGNAIEFCQRILGDTFQHAVQKLVEHDSIGSKPYTPGAKEKTEWVFPEKALNCKRVIAYLTKTRLIPTEIVQALLNEKLLYQDNFGNAVFVCRESGKDYEAIIRGTHTETSFFSRVGDGDYPFLWLPSHEKKVLTVSESPIESLSIAALYPQSRKTIHAGIGGVKFIESVEQVLQRYPTIEKMILAFNNDDAGKAAVKKFMERFGSRVKTEAFLPVLEDWNQQWKAKCNQTARQERKAFER